MSDKNNRNNKIKTEYCENCGAIMVKKPNCIVCGAKYGKKAPSKAEQQYKNQEGHETITPNQMYAQRNVAKRFAWAIIFCVLAVAIMVFAYEYVTFQSLNRLYNTNNTIMYQHSNNTLKIYMPSLNKSLVIDRYYKNSTDTLAVKQSHSERFIAYLGHQQETDIGVEGNLILVDLTNLKDKNDNVSVKKVFITKEHIVAFEFIPKTDKLIYLTEDGTLYLCDYSALSGLIPRQKDYDLVKLDTDVAAIGEIKESAVIYQKKFTNKTYTLNRLDISEDNYSSIKIDENIREVLSTDKILVNIIYSKAEESGKLGAYSWNMDKGVTKMVSEIDEVLTANAETKEIYYKKTGFMNFKISDILNDDLITVDKELVEILQNKDNLIKDQTYSQEEIDKLEEGLVKQEERDKLRDNFNRLIKEMNSQDLLYNLYYYSEKTGTEKLIAEEMLSNGENQKIQIDSVNEFLMYIDKRFSNFAKIELSRLSEEEIKRMSSLSYSVENLLSENVLENLALYSINKKQVKNIFSAKGTRTIGNFEFSISSRTIHFLNYETYDSNVGILYSVPYTNDNIGEVVYVDEYVYEVVGFYNGHIPGLIYQTASKDDVPTYALYSYSNDGIYEIDYDTASSSYSNIVSGKEERFFYFKNYNQIRGSGDLYELEDFSSMIGANIEEYILLDDKMIILQQAKRNNKSLLVVSGDNYIEIDNEIGSHVAFDSEFLPETDN